MALEEVMILLRESDRPKNVAEKVAEYLARPPQPILRFYGDFTVEEGSDGAKHLLFSVRNGIPLPLMYGIYVKAVHRSSEMPNLALTDYVERTDHIGTFSTDNWRLTILDCDTAVIDIRVGVVPFQGENFHLRRCGDMKQNSLSGFWPPRLPRIRIPSPFGAVSLPEQTLSRPKLPSWNEQSRLAIRHAIGIDLSMIPGLIPWVGDIVADVVEDLHGAELRKILTSKQYTEFLKQDKVAPATIAMIRALTK